MTLFGTSAYLKLLALNPQPRNTEIRKRLSVSKGGYDFHKSMRRIATDFASGNIDWPTTETRLEAIIKHPERQSAIFAVKALVNWLDGRPIRLLRDAEQQATSPNAVFSVRFSPDFEIDIDGAPTRIHIWNTARPSIRIREAIGTLGLFVSDDAPRAIGVLSLQTGELFLGSDAKSARELSRFLALDVERRFVHITAEQNATRSIDEVGVKFAKL